MNTNSQHKIPRVLFVSDALPPFVGGSATLMFNLLLGLDTSESILVTQSKQGYSMARAGGYDPSCSLQIHRKEVTGIPKIFARGSRWGLPVAAMMTKIPEIVNRAVKSAKEIDAQIVMTCWPSDPFTAAGWLTAHRLKLPLIVYLHDLWYETRRTALQRGIAGFLESRVLKAAAQVLVITPPTADYLKEKVGINCKVLEHSVNSQLWPLNAEITRTKHKPHKLLMLGSVNKFNQDSVIAFSKAVTQIPDIKLTILTSQKIEDLQKISMDCSCISCSFCPRNQLKESILQADALYLALGFDTPVQKEVEVVIPTRLMDYLPTGIPIIAHGPGNTWTVQEAQNRGWGYTINSLDIDAIKTSLLNFLHIPDYGVMVRAALEEARRRDYYNQSKLLAGYLNQASNGSNSPQQMP